MKFNVLILVAAIILSGGGAAAQQRLELGKLRQKTIAEVHNDLHIGCEALDRGYADYDAYKGYLEPLGMRYLRLQAGWARIEQKKGSYNFKWLDRIIDDAVNRGLEPWLQTSYGNPIYKDGGTPFINGGWPTSDEAKAAWDRWVRALAERYKGKVHTWEIWNEPDELVDPYRGKVNGKHQYGPRVPGSFEGLVDLQIRTAEIIRSVDPDAVIAACGLARLDPAFVEELVVAFKAAGKDRLFDYITYHGYKYRPEDMYPIVAKMQAVLDRQEVKIALWQGESGAPSRANSGGALRDYEWTEISQAKWNLRRVLSDRARMIRSGIYTIVDHNYARTKAAKGLLETNSFNKVVGTKAAYHAMRNLVSVYDNLDRPLPGDCVRVETAEQISKYLFEDDDTKLKSVVLWIDADRPNDSERTESVTVALSGFNFVEPVCVDLRTGIICRLPVSDDGNLLHDVPLYDSPVLITEASLVI